MLSVKQANQTCMNICIWKLVNCLTLPIHPDNGNPQVLMFNSQILQQCNLFVLMLQMEIFQAQETVGMLRQHMNGWIIKTQNNI